MNQNNNKEEKDIINDDIIDSIITDDDEINLSNQSDKKSDEIFDENDIIDIDNNISNNNNNNNQSLDLFEDIIHHGFRDPITNHAFQVTSFIIPKPCVYCKAYLYPFSGVVNCLYCKTIVHRECMKEIQHCTANIVKNDEQTSETN